MRLALFVKLKYETCTIILFVENRYSMRDLLSDLNNSMPDSQTSDMHQMTTQIRSHIVYLIHTCYILVIIL